MDPHLDDRGDAHGRWLDLVRAGDDAVCVWRPAAFFGHWRRWVCRNLGYFRFQGIEENEPAAAALPDRTALLVEGATAGSVLVSFRTHYDGVLDRAGGQLLLSLARRRAFFPRAEHCGFPHRAGHAFSERCVGGSGERRGAGRRFYHV